MRSHIGAKRQRRAALPPTGAGAGFHKGAPGRRNTIFVQTLPLSGTTYPYSDYARSFTNIQPL
jgi:hypothetical protein